MYIKNNVIQLCMCFRNYLLLLQCQMYFLRLCLVLGVVLLSTTEISVPPRLLPAFNAGEGGSAEKVKWIWALLQDEEKVGIIRGSATSQLGSYPCALAFLLSRTNHCPLHACHIKAWDSWLGSGIVWPLKTVNAVGEE